MLIVKIAPMINASVPSPSIADTTAATGEFQLLSNDGRRRLRSAGHKPSALTASLNWSSRT